MIKKLAVSIMLIILLLLVGCAREDSNFLEYQSKDFNADAILEINSEKYTVNIKKTEDDMAFTFLSPETISGVTIKKQDGQLFFSMGDVVIPLKDNTNITAETLKLFSLSKKDMTYTNATLLNGVKVNIAEFSCDFGNVKLYLSTDTDLPIMMETEIKGTDISLSFTSFELSEA